LRAGVAAEPTVNALIVGVRQRHRDDWSAGVRLLNPTERAGLADPALNVDLGRLLAVGTVLNVLAAVL
jgi:hypothetical protein